MESKLETCRVHVASFSLFNISPSHPEQENSTVSGISRFPLSGRLMTVAQAAFCEYFTLLFLFSLEAWSYIGELHVRWCQFRWISGLMEYSAFGLFFVLQFCRVATIKFIFLHKYLWLISSYFFPLYDEFWQRFTPLTDAQMQ